jgi:branched-chain amino acid transport system permease protein
MTSQLVLNGLIAGCSFALVALGFTLIYSVSRIFHFAHGGVYTVGAYTTYALITALHLSPMAAILGGVGAASLLGAVIDFFIYLPLKRRGAGPLVLLLASLGLLIVIQNLASLAFGDDTRVLSEGPVKEGIAIFGGRITAIQLISIAVCVFLAVITWLALRLLTYGKMLRAVANDSELCYVLGVPARALVVLTFFYGSALAGVAGILTGYDNGVTPLIGFHALLMGVVAAIVGGIGSVSGAFLGGLILGMTRSLAANVFSSRWQDAIVFVILVVFLLFRPQGLLGRPPRIATV